MSVYLFEQMFTYLMEDTCWAGPAHLLVSPVHSAQAPKWGSALTGAVTGLQYQELLQTNQITSNQMVQAPQFGFISL